MNIQKFLILVDNCEHNFAVTKLMKYNENGVKEELGKLRRCTKCEKLTPPEDYVSINLEVVEISNDNKN